ncbi:MAG: Uma2 family endonuclease [Planctomycetes bacterium]|nr:Uma2 family endonuclease [Planctomycetota bacterium]
MGAALAKKHKRNGLLTSAEYMALPDDGNRYELIHGELVMSPSSNFGHGSVALYVAGKMSDYARRKKLGRVTIETDVVIAKALVLRPDIAFVSSNQLAIIRGHIYGPPDLAVEITSPSNWQMDVFAKMREYERFGIREYWVLDIVDQRYKAYQWCLRGKRYHGGLVQGREIKSLVLKGFKLNLEDVWASATW